LLTASRKSIYFCRVRSEIGGGVPANADRAPTLTGNGVVYEVPKAEAGLHVAFKTSK